LKSARVSPKRPVPVLIRGSEAIWKEEVIDMSSKCFGVLGNDRIQSIQDILDAKSDICRGLEDLCRALKNLHCGRSYEAQKNLVDGIHCIKKGICLLEEGLHDHCDILDCNTVREIQKGIHVLREAIGILCGVLKDICCEQECEAEKCLIKGFELVTDGICIIEKALNRLFLY